MLVISRRIGESFLIGEEIEVTVVDITGDKVVLSIKAPKDIPITRFELIEEVKRLNQQAGENSGKINANSFSKLYKARFPGKKEL